ncbi:MAG TPA: serine hydrolase [Reyranella sp.]|jgi:CubicO group peptidase (beta-lactamase class C family)
MRRRTFVSVLGGAALAPLTALPVSADPVDGCGVPVARDDGWPVASAHDDKLIDRGALCRMADRLAGTTNVHAVLVARGGKLLFERYFSGPDEVSDRKVANRTFDADTLHDMKSVSKSVASLALGIAIDRGLIRSVDEPIFSFFPELSDLRSPERDRLLLVHALTMSMGLKWVEATPATGDEDNDEARMHRSRDQCRYVLGLPRTAPPGQEFFYNTGALALVSATVRKATGRPLDEFAHTALFEPLGITAVEWRRFKGDTDAGGGLRLRPRDAAKIGQLVLAGGRWNDRQIVSKAWIDASTAPRLAAESGSYGYLWWLRHSPLNGREVHWTGALGRGGQSIRIVPELDLVVVVTAGYYQDYSRQAFQVQRGVFDDVLRAIPSAG